MSAVLSMTVAQDLIYGLLDDHIKGKAHWQTIQDKPLLRLMKQHQQTFDGGKGDRTHPVQGTKMSDTAGFIQGFSEDDAISFAQSENLQRAEYGPWKEIAAGLKISETELKKNGISITDGPGGSKKSQREGAFKLTDMFENRKDDFSESWAVSRNSILWADGSADAKVPVGITSILTDTPTVGTTGGIDRADPDGNASTWWQHRARLGNLTDNSRNQGPALATSEAGQELTKFLRKEVTQLRRFGGKPQYALCGSDWLEALRIELAAKGFYTMNGWNKPSATELAMADVRYENIDFSYDPTLDDLGMSKRCYVWDPKHLWWAVMKGEDDKLRTPVRPYNCFVLLQNLTLTGLMEADQLNCHGVYEIA